MSVKTVLLLSLLVLLGLTGCRSRRSTAETKTTDCSTVCRKTGPLDKSQAANEALAAVLAQAEEGSTCNVASVREKPGAYEVCIRIDSPPTSKRKLPEHWTVEVPKGGIVQGSSSGAG